MGSQNNLIVLNAKYKDSQNQGFTVHKFTSTLSLLNQITFSITRRQCQPKVTTTTVTTGLQWICFVQFDSHIHKLPAPAAQSGWCEQVLSDTSTRAPWLMSLSTCLVFLTATHSALFVAAHPLLLGLSPSVHYPDMWNIMNCTSENHEISQFMQTKYEIIDILWAYDLSCTFIIYKQCK